MLSTNLTNVRETGSVIDNAHFNVVRNASGAFPPSGWLSMAQLLTAASHFPSHFPQSAAYSRQSAGKNRMAKTTTIIKTT